MGRKETTLVVAMAANLLLIGMKYALANLSGSMALAADAWHSLADLFVTAVVLLGLILAGRQRPGRDARRIEHGVAVLVAIFIFYMGYRVLADVVGGHEHELSNVFVVALGALLTIAISYFMGRFKLYVGRETVSPALIADGYHSTMHMYSSVVVVAGLFGYLIGFRSLDRVAAVLVALFIGYTGYHILADAAAGLSAAGAPAHSSPASIWRPSPRLVRLFALALGAVYLLSGLYYVQPGEQGVVRRFGQRLAVAVPPGLHYRLPWPFEGVTRVAVADIRRYAAPPLELLTGDENLLLASLTVQYDVANAADFLFNVERTDKLLGAAAGAALRSTIGQKETDYLLTTGRAEVESQAAERLQGILDAQQAGLRVLSVRLVSIAPPKEVADSFVDVASAREDKATFINEALAYQNELVPKARGDAEKMLREAEAYRAEKINAALGEAGRFRDKQAQYAQAPEVTTTRLYLEAIERVLPKVKKFVVSPEVREGSLDLWFVGEGATLPQLPRAPTQPGGVSPQAPATPQAPAPAPGR